MIPYAKSQHEQKLVMFILMSFKCENSTNFMKPLSEKYYGHLRHYSHSIKSLLQSDKTSIIHKPEAGRTSEHCRQQAKHSRPTEITIIIYKAACNQKKKHTISCKSGCPRLVQSQRWILRRAYEICKRQTSGFHQSHSSLPFDQICKGCQSGQN